MRATRQSPTPQRGRGNGVVRAWALARHQHPAGEAATPLAILGGLLLRLLRLALAPASTLAGSAPGCWRSARSPPAAGGPPAPHPRKATKTARFLDLVTERHGSLASIPLNRVIAHNALTRLCATPRPTVTSRTTWPRWSTPRRPVRQAEQGIAVWRSVRLGGDTKTSKSRRTLGLPQAAAEALREHRARQDEEKLAAGELWRDHDLVFTTAVGTELDAANVRRYFRGICTAAGIGDDWTPRELRTSFVSLLSATGVPVEEIARLAGHSSTRTTEVIYRKELRPVLVKGAEVMDQILS